MTRITRAVGWVGVVLLIMRLSDALQGVFLARWFEREVVGLVAVLFMLNTGIQVLTAMGHEAALVQRRDDRLDHAIDTAFTAAVLRGLLLFGIGALVSPWVAQFYREPTLGPLIAASSGSFAILGLRNLSVVHLTRELELKRPKLVSAIATLTGLLTLVVTTVILDSVWSVVIATLTTSLVDVVGTHVIAPRRARFGWDFALFQELYRYGRHIWFVGILIFLVTQLDDAVVGRVQGLEQLSLYAIAYTIANIPIVQISAVVGQVGMPAWSAALRQGDVERRNRMFVSTVRLSGAITIALCAALMAGGPELLELVFGAKWRPAYAPLVILLFFGLVRGISANFGALFNSLGRPGIISADIGTKVVIIAVLIYPMTEAYGIVGAALSVTLPMVVITPIAAALYFRIAGISARAVLGTLVRPTAACIPAAIVALGLRVGLDGAVAPGLLRTLTVSLVPTIATAGVVLGIAWVTDPELRRLLARRAPPGEALDEPPAPNQVEST